ncbi:hypothetical protein MUU74_07495 [Chryseobacterium daecheongense]|uniref:DUF6705 family protein n=1 Tax=Chryseobacterium daecheongense TaxID=192389 RepID=UPI001FD64E31|nr:DUF6705 family protein [Chryseobacterium daecheongense]UOU99793.1 hypothetical protein MUU74_07495 [Chryseobacterium daecheongense]
MKKIFLLSAIIFLFVQCKAQSNIVALTNCNKEYDHSTGDYYLKDTTNEMDKYEGVWKWTNGNKEFTLTLIKQVKHHFNQYGNDNYFEDRLVGYYQYKENGLLIADTSSDDLSKDYGVKVQFTLDCHSQISSIAFRDYKKYKKFEVILESLSPTQIKMNMYETEHVIMINKKTGTKIPPNDPQGGSTFPMEMILTKQ